MNPLFDRVISKQEAELGASLDYLRDIAGTSSSAFLKFGLFAPLAQHRKALSPEVWHLARLGATQVQDCGTCVQIVVNAARADGVAPDVLRTALSGGTPGGDALEPDRQLALDYGRAVAQNGDDVQAAVEAARARFGDDGLVELALAVATAQVFPVVKRGLGRATACALVEIELE